MEIIAAVLGVVGSALLAIPAVKHQKLLKRYKDLLSIEGAARVGQELDEVAKEVRDKQIKSFMTEFEGVQYYSVLYGCIALGLSFLLSLVEALSAGG